MFYEAFLQLEKGCLRGQQWRGGADQHEFTLRWQTGNGKRLGDCADDECKVVIVRQVRLKRSELALDLALERLEALDNAVLEVELGCRVAASASSSLDSL